jgi:hypothetical protein
MEPSHVVTHATPLLARDAGTLPSKNMPRLCDEVVAWPKQARQLIPNVKTSSVIDDVLGGG